MDRNEKLDGLRAAFGKITADAALIDALRRRADYLEGENAERLNAFARELFPDFKPGQIHGRQGTGPNGRPWYVRAHRIIGYLAADTEGKPIICARVLVRPCSGNGRAYARRNPYEHLGPEPAARRPRNVGADTLGRFAERITNENATA